MDSKETKLLIGTKKGAFILSGVKGDQNWDLSDPILLGNSIYHFIQDFRDLNSLLIATTTGHLGPTVFSSSDMGITWKEAVEPPKFTHTNDEKKSVDKVFWLSAGHKSEKGTIYAGTSPQGLFISKDSGITWSSFDQFNQHPEARIWMDNNGTPIGPLLHSINIDDSDKNHMILALSLGGVIETFDSGLNWKPLNSKVLADFQPEPYPVYGQCVHNLQISPANSKIFYQQNHCGIYKLDRTSDNGNNDWERIGNSIPEDIGDIGFPLVLHPTNPDILWVWPMDSTDVWPRTSKDGKPAVYGSEDGGKSWNRLNEGFPSKNAWFTVRRQAMTRDDDHISGIYLGTSSGEIWGSFDGGKYWQCLARNLPDISSVFFAR